MALVLAKSIALKSNNNNKYLRYVSEEGSARLGFVQFSGEEILNPNVKFEVEAASTGNGLVHIRSCYNNKYWRRWSENHNWIVAGAEKQVEDQSLWSCTLFEPVKADDGSDDNSLIIRLCHVQLGLYLRLFSPSADFMSCLYANYDKPSTENWDLFTVRNWASLVALPKYIALKGDNGKYLTAAELPFLQFISSDIGEEGAAHEVFPTSDGNIRIKTYQSQYDWELLPNIHPFPDWKWIWAYVASGSNDSKSLFQPVKVGDGSVIALKNLYTDKFCRRDPEEQGQNKYRDGLKPDATSITEGAKLVVEEAVLKRTLSITYRLEDARMYDVVLVTMVTVEHNNHDTDPITKHVTLGYTNSTTTTWDASLSWMVGIKVTIEVDAIPLVEKGSVELSAEFGGSYQWGETKTDEQTLTESDDYVIKGKHKLIVRKLATKGHCDVPYSYTQTDTLYDGSVIGPITKYDGVYKGVNCFDFYTDSYQEPL